MFFVKDSFRNGKEVALKVLADENAFDEHTLIRFKEELQICSSIRHPNLVEAYDLIDLGDNVAFTMEFVNGYDLSKAIKEKMLPFEDIDSIVGQVLLALAELHRHNIIHRDIKLENVLVGYDGTVKLSDLGLMKKLDARSLTRPGVLLGTAQYMPPEYIKEGKYDARGDLYAVGILLYELLTGKRRLQEMAGMQAIEYLIKTKFSFPRITLSGLPRKYRDVIERALEVDPRKRFQSAAEMRDALVNNSGEIALASEAITLDPKLSVKSYAIDRSRESALFTTLDSVPGVSRKYLFLFAMLTTVVVMVGFRFLTPAPKSYILFPGKYHGEINMYGNTGFLKKVTLTIDDASRIIFNSELSGCQSGIASLESGDIICEQPGFVLSIADVSSDGFSGTISDTKAGAQHTFSVSKAGKSRKESAKLAQ